MGKTSPVLSGILCMLIVFAVSPWCGAAINGGPGRGKTVNLVEAKGEIDLGHVPRLLRVTRGTLISSLLLALGILGLIIEFRTPFWGIAGTIGVICLIIFFWGHWTMGLVGWEEILLLGIGIFLLILEAYVPGFGLPGILGMSIIAFAFTLSLVSRHPTPGEFLVALFHILLVACAVLAMFFSTKSLAKKRGAAVGDTGMTISDLCPSGIGEFDDRRLNIIADGIFIKRDTRVRIVRIEKDGIFVKEEPDHVDSAGE
ncbi:MAG: hypothetical protein ACMUIS_06540 [bacterium]